MSMLTLKTLRQRKTADELTPQEQEPNVRCGETREAVWGNCLELVCMFCGFELGSEFSCQETGI